MLCAVAAIVIIIVIILAQLLSLVLKIQTMRFDNSPHSHQLLCTGNYVISVSKRGDRRPIAI